MQKKSNLKVLILSCLGYERNKGGAQGGLRAGGIAVKQLNRDRPPVTGIQNWRLLF